MWPLIVTIFVFLILSVYLITVFVSDLLQIIINVVLMWVIIVRAFFEVRTKRIIIPYFIGLGITMILFMLFFDYLKVPYLLWQILFVTIMFIIAELIVLFIHLDKKHKWGIMDKIKSKFKKK